MNLPGIETRLHLTLVNNTTIKREFAISTLFLESWSKNNLPHIHSQFIKLHTLAIQGFPVPANLKERTNISRIICRQVLLKQTRHIICHKNNRD